MRVEEAGAAQNDAPDPSCLPFPTVLPPRTQPGRSLAEVRRARSSGPYWTFEAPGKEACGRGGAVERTN